MTPLLLRALVLSCAVKFLRLLITVGGEKLQLLRYERYWLFPCSSSMIEGALGLRDCSSPESQLVPQECDHHADHQRVLNLQDAARRP